MSTLTKTLAQLRDASRTLALLDSEVMDRALKSLATALRKNSNAILKANAEDLAKMDQKDPKFDRLKLTEERIGAIAKDVSTVASLPSPLHRTLDERKRPNGLHITKVSVPIGVIGIIYEARPNVTVDAFALCFKSGNACALKGGSDAQASNEALARIIHDVLQSEGIDEHALALLPPDRSVTEELLHANGLVDVIIPRGSQSLIDFVRENATVPVIETGAGIVHTYVDKSADLKKATDIVLNAKTRRPSVCNALDTLIIHRDRLGDLPSIAAPLAEKGVSIFADPDAYRALKGKYDSALLREAKPEHFGTEFLSLKMSVKTVSSLEEALEHIATYGSKHSEAIVSEDQQSIDTFLKSVDAAAVYANASTSFSDGAQFGMGGEIGISTQKLHVRGPMGLTELTSYKWIVRGDGQVRP
ncbi:MAG: glutamate-5-semialdehyde dehydrogenase [Candidatus Peregrinibacteria bacterium]|nr:glutamate-5-semialdehyde dehydrogenase [Candidatus Peregrinibacteria bacterium]